MRLSLLPPHHAGLIPMGRLQPAARPARSGTARRSNRLCHCCRPQLVRVSACPSSSLPNGGLAKLSPPDTCTRNGALYVCLPSRPIRLGSGCGAVVMAARPRIWRGRVFPPGNNQPAHTTPTARATASPTKATPGKQPSTTTYGPPGVYGWSQITCEGKNREI